MEAELRGLGVLHQLVRREQIDEERREAALEEMVGDVRVGPII